MELKRVSSKHAKLKRFPKLRIKFSLLCTGSQIPVAAQAKAWVCGRSLAGIAGRIPPAERIFVCCECCVLSGRGLPRADHSSRKVLPSVCVTECDQWIGKEVTLRMNDKRKKIDKEMYPSALSLLQ